MDKLTFGQIQYQRHKQFLQKNPKLKKKELERRRMIYQANKEKEHERMKKYRITNKDKINEKRRQYYQANKEKEREKKKQYREANIDKIREKDRIRKQQFQIQNPTICPRCRKNTIINGFKSCLSCRKKPADAVCGVSYDKDKKCWRVRKKGVLNKRFSTHSYSTSEQAKLKAIEYLNNCISQHE